MPRSAREKVYGLQARLKDRMRNSINTNPKIWCVCVCVLVGISLLNFEKEMIRSSGLAFSGSKGRKSGRPQTCFLKLNSTQSHLKPFSFPPNLPVDKVPLCAAAAAAAVLAKPNIVCVCLFPLIHPPPLSLHRPGCFDPLPPHHRHRRHLNRPRTHHAIEWTAIQPVVNTHSNLSIHHPSLHSRDRIVGGFSLSA